MNERLAPSANWHLVCFIVSADTSDRVHNTPVHYVRCENTKQAFTAGQQTQSRRSSEGGIWNTGAVGCFSCNCPKGCCKFSPHHRPPLCSSAQASSLPCQTIGKRNPCLKRLAAVGRGAGHSVLTSNAAFCALL